MGKRLSTVLAPITRDVFPSCAVRVGNQHGPGQSQGPDSAPSAQNAAQRWQERPTLSYKKLLWLDGLVHRTETLCARSKGCWQMPGVLHFTKPQHVTIIRDWCQCRCRQAGLE